MPWRRVNKIRRRVDNPRRKVNRIVFEKIVTWLKQPGNKRKPPEEFSDDYLSFCSILKDISRGKDSPNYHVLKQCAYNNEVVEQFIIENAKFAFSYFAPLELKESYYEILNVSSTYSTAELRRKWLDLMKIYHPDKFGDRGIDVVKRINEAYEVLRDPMRRKDYEARRPHVFPVVLAEPTWREIASDKFTCLLTAILRWKDLYNVARKTIKGHKDSTVNMARFPRQHWLSVRKRRTAEHDFAT